MRFVLASGNKNKYREFKRILEPLGIELLTKSDVNADEFDPEETATTFAGNAKIKAEEMVRLSGLPSIADDSGLMVDALNGEPGVYSARYAGENATNEDKYNLVLQKLRDVPKDKRTAKFVSSICCIIPEDNTIITAEGYCNGNISFKPSGKGGFGYDPIFLPNEYNGEKSFAELTGEQKDKISHRGRALKQFAQKLENLLKEKEYDNK